MKCKKCQFATPDPTASDNNWTAYQCSNKSSVYYKCLLNVTINGCKLPKIAWRGCRYGKAVVK